VRFALVQPAEVLVACAERIGQFVQARGHELRAPAPPSPAPPAAAARVAALVRVLPPPTGAPAAPASKATAAVGTPRSGRDMAQCTEADLTGCNADQAPLTAPVAVI
jgi:hypothetical protein